MPRRRGLYEDIRGCFRKTKFGSKRAAKMRIKSIAGDGGPTLGYYECKQCFYFHLTKNKKAQGQKF